MLEKLRGLLGSSARVAIVTHRRADADALACAKVLELVLAKLGVAVVAVSCPEGSPLGGCTEALPQDVDMYVLADVASLNQVPPMSKSFIKVDHHAVGDDIPGISLDRPSCTEIALELAEEAGVEIPPDVAKLAILGIYADTGKLKRADARTLRLLASLLEKTGGTLGDAVGEGGESTARQRTFALLKGMQRLEIYETSAGIVCTSYVGAYEADLASLLISVGCDVSLVASRKKDGVHIVMRSRRYDVATLAKSLGAGGGHREAAVAVLHIQAKKGQLPAILRDVVKKIDRNARMA
ncbi:DHH family phosphoesterase [Pyrobaculum neutrophilum]|uniref:Phosphoesterase RecJ domain protein n=1 Tax=Pyrobaculum neutrophilum (strain DSM 2338 / JCM 9278 / NBRC 100436 / V24Sta) TaxID=444157 RepID=B1Y971_PYRNV|nr:DHH family phosphoesterase [Pyrobaculum neutrophilum]ACB40300.1 phosphoesterase RecJ domain protein [Pyrobaculum neutrophilum V24Sta]